MSNLKTSSIIKTVSLGIASFAMAACATTAVSEDYDSPTSQLEGLDGEQITFPVLEKAWFKEGIFPNLDNLHNIHEGIGKDGLQHLIGRPHFNEGFNTKEWDYIFNFKNPDGTIKVCQYKVLFDSEYKGQDFYWSSESCENTFSKKLDERSLVVAAPTINYSEPAMERVSFSSDALFSFDGYKASDMLSQGAAEIRSLASRLKEHQNLKDFQVVVTGHTDRIGDDRYNMNLSQLRAQTVRKLLIDNGVDPKSIIAVGAGESEPLVECSSGLGRQQAISCLTPNRRVTVDFSAYK